MPGNDGPPGINGDGGIEGPKGYDGPKVRRYYFPLFDYASHSLQTTSCN